MADETTPSTTRSTTRSTTPSTGEPATGRPAPEETSDPHAWLEEVTGEDALAWVRERNDRALAEITADPGFARLEERILEVLDADDRIPQVTQRGAHLYNFWIDAEHRRGLWRRTTRDSYRTASPEWEILLDVDALNDAEGEDWVFHGASVLRPADRDPHGYRRALIDLSHGGSDADVTREFDLETKRFVDAADGGFHRPEAKGSVHWIDEDTVFVATDTGEGTLTTSGYPRQVRRWRRGTPLTDAELVFEGLDDDMSVVAVHDDTRGFERDWVLRLTGFYSRRQFLRHDDELVELDLPDDMRAFAHRELLFLLPRSDWETPDAVYPSGSLLAIDLDRFLAGDRDVSVVFEPTASAALEDVTVTRSVLVLTILEDVRHRLEALRHDGHGHWERTDLFPHLTGTLSVAGVDDEAGDELWVTTTDYITPTTLMIADLATDDPEPEALKQGPAFFDADGLEVTQCFATSDDGTRVPYFQVARADLTSSGDAPTLLYGYGGFEISLTPGYSGIIGRAWLERGGVYAVANIRGGGEYGPAWHQAALTENRHRAYEDFAAVARDLVERGVTRVERLGARGGSNGGLLMGNMLTLYPELFGAIVCQVPLLDMKRYSHLLAGASWRDEYGDPDTDDWEFLRSFSPYHLIQEDRRYPPALFTTSTKDDRVHPGHARKMMAAMEAVGADVRYWENIEGGHGGSADNKQAARMNALIYTFLHQQLAADRD